MRFLRPLLYTFLGMPCMVFAQVNDGINNPYTNWDGITHWSRYLTIAPGKLGPNALPVPKLEQGRIDSVWYLQSSFIYHHNPEDKTPTVFLKGVAPLGKKAALEVSGVVFEQFNMSQELRYDRRTFKQRGEGKTFGDIYVRTHATILKDYKKWPDVALHVGLKTTTGGHLDAARFSDTPGYQFYVSAGKSKTLPTLDATIRWFVQAGFYSWQTYSNLHRQNDAVMYGAGVALQLNNYVISHALTGYVGYLNNGDQPMLYRFEIGKEGKRKTSFSYQYGIHDFDYHSFAFNYFFQYKNE